MLDTPLGDVEVPMAVVVAGAVGATAWDAGAGLALGVGSLGNAALARGGSPSDPVCGWISAVGAGAVCGALDESANGGTSVEASFATEFGAVLDDAVLDGAVLDDEAGV